MFVLKASANLTLLLILYKISGMVGHLLQMAIPHLKSLIFTDIIHMYSKAVIPLYSPLSFPRLSGNLSTIQFTI